MNFILAAMMDGKMEPSISVPVSFQWPEKDLCKHKVCEQKYVDTLFVLRTCFEAMKWMQHTVLLY